jgi:glycosyltransferase involved in cell wall biosynthesis
MSDQSPLVTVVVPAWNEASDIERCLGAIALQDYPHQRMEVIVVDGCSHDSTRACAERLLRSTDIVHRVLDNPGRTIPSNLNVGLAHARGDVLIRVDARSIVPPDYVRRCVEVLESRPEVSVVGGAQVALARDGSARAVGIARALNNRWGMGLSRYRRGASSGPADTVYLGAFRTRDLRAVGGWGEQFTINEDFELNRRMSRHGLVWFESGLEVGYLPRRSLTELYRQYRRFGEWKARYWLVTGDPPRPRQVVLLVAPPILAAVAVLGLWLDRRRRPAWVAAGVAAVGVFEAVGPSRPAPSAAARVFSVAASATIAAGWLRGAWGGLLRSLGKGLG